MITQNERELIKRLDLEFRREGIEKVDDKTKLMLWRRASKLPNFELMIGLKNGTVLGSEVRHLPLYSDVLPDEYVAVPMADYAFMDTTEHYKFLRKSWSEGTEENNGKMKTVKAYEDWVIEKHEHSIGKKAEEVTTKDKEAPTFSFFQRLYFSFLALIRKFR